MLGMLIFAALWALSYRAAAASAASQEVEAFPDEVSLLQKNLALSAEKPGLQQEPAEQQGVLLTQSGGQRVRTIPSVAINLDLPPEERWHAALGDELKELVFVPQVWNTTLLNSIDFAPYEEVLREMRGIVKAVNDPSVTVEHMLAAEIGYENGFTKGCTGVLAATPDGTLFHGRNLDLQPFLRVGFEHRTREVTYYRGGKPLFSTSTFGVSPGVHTGYRIGSWSVAQNTRGGCEDRALNAEAARRGGHPFQLLLRSVIQEVGTFEEAVHRLAEVPLIAPQYFTVAGAGAWQGALISRDRLGYSAPYPNVEQLSPQIGRWFIVQTNDDTWKPEEDERRPTALTKLTAMKPAAMNAETMLSVMTTDPVLNSGTIFTWVLQPSTGLRRVYLGSDELRGDLSVPAFVSDIGVSDTRIPPPR